MKIKYDIVGVPKKLEQETSSIDERFRILYADGVVFEFFDITASTKWEYTEVDGEQVQVEGSDVTTYSKITAIEDVIVDDEVVKQVPVYIDYTSEFEAVVVELNGIISLHPSEDPNPDLTIEERMDRLELIALQTEGVI